MALKWKSNICQAVQEARRLMDKDLIAKSDPYCVIKCGPEGFLSQNGFRTTEQLNIFSSCNLVKYKKVKNANYNEKEQFEPGMERIF